MLFTAAERAITMLVDLATNQDVPFWRTRSGPHVAAKTGRCNAPAIAEMSSWLAQTDPRQYPIQGHPRESKRSMNVRFEIGRAIWEDNRHHRDQNRDTGKRATSIGPITFTKLQLAAVRFGAVATSAVRMKFRVSGRSSQRQFEPSATIETMGGARLMKRGL